MKYAEIRAVFDLYFPVYGQNRIRVFPYLHIIWILFCPHTGKYGSEKARISTNLVSFNQFVIFNP